MNLNTPIDNSPLIFFRLAFGLLIFLESAGALITGWVKRVFIVPDFTFTFIGFEWLQPLPGNGMYFYYALMAFFGLLVMVGLYYKFALSAFTLMWTATYLMQKSSYNNHYYLLILLCLIMLVLPAHRYLSFDAKRDPKIKSLSCPKWCFWLVIVQLGIVYTFAAIAKIYPDWLEGLPVRLWFSTKAEYPFIGPLLQKDGVIYSVAYGGILFDLLIVPLMLWRKTRWLGLLVSLCFHIFNSIIFQIGIFPYLMLAALVFFFDPEKVRQIFFRNKPPLLTGQQLKTSHWEFKALGMPVFSALLGLYLLLQLYLPLRHWFYQGDVYWTEEGHRMAWQMMARSKYGRLSFTVKIPSENKTTRVAPSEYVARKQARKMATSPDLIWQFCQRLKAEYADKGYDTIEIYAHSRVSLNGGPYFPLIDPAVNLAEVKWERFAHSSWITPAPLNQRSSPQK